MGKNPLGLIAQINALSLMLITPEYFRIRRLRSKKAARVTPDTEPTLLKLEYFHVDGLKVRYATRINGGRPTILFLSPLPQSILCYEPVWKLLSEDFDLIALDLPGFGGSEGKSELMNFTAQSDFLASFVEETGLADVHIIAPDVAMPVAMHYATRQDHKAKTILIGDGPGIVPSADGSLIKKIVGSGFWRTMVRLNGAKTFIAGAFQLGYLHYSPTVSEVQDYVKSYSGRIGAVTEYFKSYTAGCRALTEQIDLLKLPVKVFWGDEDAFLKADNAHQLHKKLPTSSLHIFRNCGHFCYQDKSDEFAVMVKTWIAEESVNSL